MADVTGYTLLGRLVPEESDGDSFGAGSVELFACEHCGAAVPERMQEAHTNWHRRSARGMDFGGGLL